MERATLEDHLAQAERHVAEGEEHIAQQRELVTKIEREGHDTTSALFLLSQFEEMQQMHIADQERLRGELAALERAPENSASA
jgi:hypothetical protein